MRPRILTVGRVQIETAVSLPYIPAACHTIEGKSYARFPGGSGLNTAVALTKLGADAILSARVGGDAGGQRVTNYLAAKGVDTRYLEEDSLLETGNFVRLYEDSGSCRCASFEGANQKLSNADVEFAFQSSPSGVVIHADAPDEAIISAARNAGREMIPCILDDRFGRKTMPPYEKLPHLSILLMNRDTALRCTGLEPGSVESSLRCCIALAGYISADYYVLHLEERGVFIYDGKYHHVIPTYDVSRGGCIAADAYFTAAFFTKFSVCGDIKASAEFGVIAEAAALSRSGYASDLPSAEELRQYMARYAAE